MASILFHPRLQGALRGGSAALSRHVFPTPVRRPGLEEVCAEGAAGVAAGLGFVLALGLGERGGGERGAGERASGEGAARTGVMAIAAPSAWLNERGRWLSSGGEAGAAVIVAAPRTEAETLWALEEALRSGVVDLAIGAVEAASLLATRRLDLAARAAGAVVVLVKTRPPRDSSVARRRWRVAPHPSAPHPWDPAASGAPRWRVRLERSRDGSSGEWIVEQDPETHRLRLADAMADHRLGVERSGARRAG